MIFLIFSLEKHFLAQTVHESGDSIDLKHILCVFADDRRCTGGAKKTQNQVFPPIFGNIISKNI